MTSSASNAMRKRVLELLRGGQMHKRMLCAALNTDYVNVDASVSALCRAGEVIVLGRAGDAGYRDIRIDAPVYGLPGTKLVLVNGHVTPRRPGGSGVIAGPVTIGLGLSLDWGPSVRRSSPGYYRAPPKRPTAITIRCICGRTFGSSRELRDHETRCAQVARERYIQGRPA